LCFPPSVALKISSRRIFSVFRLGACAWMWSEIDK